MGRSKFGDTAPLAVEAVRRSIARREPALTRKAAQTLGPRLAHRLLNQVRVGEKRSWSDVMASLPSEPSVLTVDVFDTVLTKRISTDEALAASAGHIARTRQLWTGSTESVHICFVM